MPTTILRVTWDANPAAEQATHYIVHERKNGGSWVAKSPTIPASGPLVFETNNPLPGIYEYKIQAVNVAGTSMESDIGTGPSVPSKPSTPIVTTVVIP